MSSINYNGKKITYKNNKFNLKEILNILNYESIEKNIFISKNQLLKNLNKERKEDKEFIEFLKECIIDEKLDINSFINLNNYIIKDIEIFNEIWSYLKNKNYILITPELIEFLEFNIESNQNKNSLFNINRNLRHFIKFLNENKIDYEELNYKNKKINNYEYILNDIKNSNPKIIHLKFYIILSLKNFKKICIIKSKRLMEFYLDFEEIFYSYMQYNKNYDFKLNEIIYKQKLKQFEKDKILELEKKDKEINKYKNQIISKKIITNDLYIKEKKEWLYIASTDLYQKESIYKIGLNKNLYKINNFKDFYYIKIFIFPDPKKVYDYIKEILINFIYNKEENLYNKIHIINLIDIINFINNYKDKSFFFIKKSIEEKIKIFFLKESLILNPLKIKSITYEIDDQKEIIFLKEKNKNLIQEVFFNLLEIIEYNYKIDKEQILHKLIPDNIEEYKKVDKEIQININILNNNFSDI